MASELRAALSNASRLTRNFAPDQMREEVHDTLQWAMSEIERLEAERDRLREALSPFARYADRHEHYWIIGGIVLGSAITCTINALIRWKQDDD